MLHMASLILILLFICVGLLVSLHLRLTHWRDASLRDAGIFIQTAQVAQRDTPPQICIQILNPLEVAEQESAIGRFLGKLSPALISRQVYLKTAESIGHEFRNRGIRAHIQIHYREQVKAAS